LADLIELHRVALVGALVAGECGLLGRGCDCHETCGADRVVGSIPVVPMVKMADASVLHEVPFPVPDW
jgi:hypothetical protein